ncbi:hypothetical protein RCL1_002046 [Eukaryota sp. TZLM3-RCL]
MTNMTLLSYRNDGIEIERGDCSEVVVTASGHSIEVYRTKNPKEKIPDDQLGFGKNVSDHMFVLEYANGAWGTPRIVPYGPIQIDPAAKVLHYGQEIFEGMKAYKWTENGSLALFRPYDNARRFNVSAARMCMPPVDESLFVESLQELIKVDRDFVPSSPGTSLYIRPTMIGVDNLLGVAPANRYLYYVILSPSAPYFAGGFKGIGIYVDKEFVRAVKGGVGEAKTGGNYAASLFATQKAQKKGFAQVLWTDATLHELCEEIGAATFFCVRNGVITTPPLTGTILRGITRNSILKLASTVGYEIAEEDVKVSDLFNGIKSGDITEVFACGTAAVLTPVVRVGGDDEETVTVGNGEPGPVATRLYNSLVDIQLGKADDKFGWTVEF